MKTEVRNEIRKVSIGFGYSIALIKVMDNKGIIWEELNGNTYVHEWETRDVHVVTPNSVRSFPIMREVKVR